MIPRRAVTTAGLLLPLTLPAARAAVAKGEAASFGAYLSITPDNQVTILVPGVELGQGVFTSLPKIFAEELEADFEAVEIRLAPGDEVFANPAKGRQSTGVSDAVQGYTPVLRRAGAAAKEMLIAAAAKKWNVDPAECHADRGRVLHRDSGRAVTFGEVASAAAALPVPADPKLKRREQFTLIGRDTLRKDTPVKVDGAAVFGADVALPDLLFATVRHCPVMGGVLARVDRAAALKRPGIVAVVDLPDARGRVVALGVIADTTWHAIKAAEALDVDWDTRGHETLDSAAMARAMHAALDDDANAKVMAFANGKLGDAAAALATAAKTISVTYELPYLAHACMEPMAATCVVRDDAVELWAPSQQQEYSRRIAADVSGIAYGNVTMHTTFAGGGFGRKWELDFTRQAVHLAMAVKGRPVRMTWTREEDIRHDFYRAGYVARVRAGVDGSGQLTAMTARLAGQSMLAFQNRSPKPPMPDATSVAGALNPRYAVPNTLIDYVETPFPVPVGFWRAVAGSQNGFISECAIDEAAALALADPLTFRRSLLKGRARELKALETVAEKCAWGRALPKGSGLGLALTAGFDAVVAQVAQVTVKAGALKIDKVWCVYDAGMIVDPLNVKAQLEGGIVFGLTAALHGEITFDKGAVVQGNFADYGMITLASMPEIDLTITESGDKPGGAGEASVPGIAPAVANAIYAATGTRIRKLPLRAAGLTVA